MKRLMWDQRVIGDYPDNWAPPEGSDLFAGLADGSMVYAVTPPPPPPTQAEIDTAAVNASISAFSFGGKTLAELKALTLNIPAFDTWWAANVTNLAQANSVLKLLARAALQRML